MGTERAVSVGILILSLLYILFALGIEERTIGRLAQVGPTARTVPLTLGVVLLGLSSVLSVQAFRTRRTDQPSEAPSRLVVITVLLSVSYIFLLRPVGFILATSALLFLLVYLSRTVQLRKIRFLPLLSGLILNGVLMMGLYWTSRSAARILTQYGRSIESAFLSNRLFGTALMLVLTTVLLIVVHFLFRRFAKDRLDNLLVPILASVGTTQVLYLVFRQVFQVNLPPGLLTF